MMEGAKKKPGLVTENWPAEAKVEIEGYALNPRLMVARIWDHKDAEGRPAWRRVSVWRDRSGRIRPGLKEVPCRLDRMGGTPIYQVV